MAEGPLVVIRTAVQSLLVGGPNAVVNVDSPYFCLFERSVVRDWVFEGWECGPGVAYNDHYYYSNYCTSHYDVISPIYGCVAATGGD